MTNTADTASSGWMRALLWIGGGMLLFFAVCPSFRFKGGGAVEQTSVQLGIPFSPLYVYEQTRIDESGADGAKSVTIQSHSDFSFFSLSMGALIASVVAFSFARVLEKAARQKAG